MRTAEHDIPLHALRRDDLDEGARTLSAAFAEDPLYQFLLPDALRRRQWLELIMTTMLQQTLSSELTFVPDQGARLGVIGALPPGSHPSPLKKVGVMLRKMPRGFLLSWRLFRSGLGFLRAIEKARPKWPHYYIQIIGVHPKHKGAGIGGNLLRHVLTLVDEAQLPVYLETSNEVNRYRLKTVA